MKKLSFKDTAKEILKDASRPLSAAEISEIALERGILSTEGKTPAATMAAQIYMDLKDNPNSDFIKVKSGLFALKNEQKDLGGEAYIARHNQQIRKKLHDHLYEIDPKEFEYLIAALLDKIGFEDVEVTGGSGDGGIDLVGALTVGGVTNVKTVIQAKRYKANIEPKVIRELRGSAELTKRGLIITTSNFSKSAIEEATQPNKMPISLVNGQHFVELLIEHEVGIKKTNVEILSIDHEFLESVGPTKNSGTSVENRSLSIWPLPGGNDQYFATLIQYLEYVSKSKPSQEQATKWFMSNFAAVESPKTAKGYTGVPRSMGLVVNEKGKFVLTDVGTSLLASKSPRDLVKVLEDNIVGVVEILEALKKEDLTEKQIWSFLNDSLDLEWKTFAQTRFRLLWLENAKAVEKLENGAYRNRSL